MNNNDKFIKQKEFDTSSPKLTLDVMAKVYLATAVKSANKLTFVYTLACIRSGNMYGLFPTTEISTFDSEKDAAIFHKTINEIMSVQSKHVGMKKIKDMMSDKIKEFHAMVR